MLIDYKQQNDNLYATVMISYRDDNGVTRKKTVYCLGRVIDKEKGLYTSREQGVVHEYEKCLVLRKFANWCLAHNPEIVLMESTSVYWRSPYEALEDVGFDNSRLAVVKATDVKVAHGRKTDKEDARRLAEFARIGRIKHSYVPPRDFREARCVARAYHKTMGKKTSAINRLHKVFCEIGCRPGSVFSDITGKTAMTILRSYINDTPEEFETTVMASRKLKASREEILDVFHNRVSDSLKRLLKVLIRTVENCERDAA